MPFLSAVSTEQVRKFFATNHEVNVGVSDQPIYEEVSYLPGSSKVDKIIGYEDNTKAVTLYSQYFTYSGSKVTQLVTVIHNPEDNTKTTTITDTFAYSGAKIQSISRIVT